MERCLLWPGAKKKSLMPCTIHLWSWGGAAVLCGELGAGNTTKLANQIIVALNIAAASEAFMLSTKAGVDPIKVFDAIKGGLAESTVMNAAVTITVQLRSTMRCWRGWKYAGANRCRINIAFLNRIIQTVWGRESFPASGR